MSINATTEFSKSNSTVDIQSHDGINYGLKLNGTLVTSSASELNKLTNVNTTANEFNKIHGFTGNSIDLNMTDITTIGQSQNSKVVTQNSSGVINIGSSSGGQILDIISHDLTSAGLKLNGSLVTSSATELNLLDGSLPGTVVNSKGVIYDSNGKVRALEYLIGTSSISMDSTTNDLILTSTENLKLTDGTAVLNLEGSGSFLYHQLQLTLIQLVL